MRLKLVAVAITCLIILPVEMLQVDEVVNCIAVGEGKQVFKGSIMELVKNCTEAKFNLYLSPLEKIDEGGKPEFLDDGVLRELESFLNQSIPGPDVPKYACNNQLAPPSENFQDNSNYVCRKFRICWKQVCKLVLKCTVLHVENCETLVDQKRVKKQSGIPKTKKPCKKKKNTTVEVSPATPSVTTNSTYETTTTPSSEFTPSPERGCYKTMCWTRCPWAANYQNDGKEWCWMEIGYGLEGIRGPIRCKTDKDCQNGPHLPNWWCGKDDGLKSCEKDLKSLKANAENHYEWLMKWKSQ